MDMDLQRELLDRYGRDESHARVKAVERVLRRRAPRVPEEQLVRLARICLEACDALAAVDVAEPRELEAPVSWQQHSERVMQHFRAERERIRTIFGLEQSLDPYRVSTFLDKLAARQQAIGECEKLCYLEAQDDREDGRVHMREQSVGAYEGWDENDWTVPLSDAVWNPPPPSAPLYRLASMAKSIHDKTGLSEARAVQWLLTDEPAELPWIDVSLVCHSLTGTEVILRIGSLAVRPNEVKEAYQKVQLDPFEAVEAGTTMRAFALLAVSKAVPYVRHRDRTQAALETYKNWRHERGIADTDKMPRGGWAEVAARFKKDHPDLTEFPRDGKSLRVTVWNATHPAKSTAERGDRHE